MAFKDLLVCLDSTSESIERLNLALDLARAEKSGRLIAADISTTTSGNDAVTRRSFEEATRDAGVDALFLSADKADQVDAFTHCVDLIIAPAGNSHDSIRAGWVERVLMESGVPILILPQDWTRGPIGRNVVIAWNGGREALRAVHDAMPFLQRAEKVTIFAFSSGPSSLRASAEMLVTHLASHGVHATVSDWTNTGDLSAIEALFASLDTQDADLFVAGAFGHSRIWEDLFGGVSLALLRQQSVPLLMSH